MSFKDAKLELSVIVISRMMQVIISEGWKNKYITCNISLCSTNQSHIGRRRLETAWSSLSHYSSLVPWCAFSSSSNVRQHLWERVRHHPEVVFWHGQVSSPDAEGQRIHPLPPDPQSAEAEAGGVLPTCLDLHQWNRHEYGTEGCMDL